MLNYKVKKFFCMNLNVPVKNANQLKMVPKTLKIFFNSSLLIFLQSQELWASSNKKIILTIDTAKQYQPVRIQKLISTFFYKKHGIHPLV